MEIDDKLIKINELKMSINNEIKQRSEPQTIIEKMSYGALSDLNKRISDIENILLIEKYDLVFIGQVGVGKTTAICHLFQLVMESKKKKKIRNKEKEMMVVEELMATGSGYTTLCEVVVKQNNSTFIEIDPCNPEDVQKMIDDYCQSIWLKIYPDSDEETKGQGTLPPELTRAVGNFVNLSRNSKDKTDPAIKLASNFDKNSFDDFSKEVFNRANMSDRNEIKIFPNKNESNLKSWLKVTFNNLNLGKNPSVSLPNRIIIHVEPSIASIGYNRIDSIVDTKGVDSEFNRKDLDTYIRDRNNSICIFTENFLAAPSNVIEIIERHMTKEAKDISTKILLFVIPRDNQPENVVGQDGTVEDRTEGISLRLNQIQDGFNSRGIRFPKENILFYDPLEYYETVGADHKILQDFEQNDIDAERKRIFTEIEQLILRREDLVWNEVQEKEKLFLEIKTGGGLDHKEEQLINDVKPKIRELGHLDFVNADRFWEDYKRPWLKTRHVMTLRATNNRYGEYQPRNIDVCYDAKPVVEMLVRKLSTRRKDAILMAISDIKSHISESSELHRLLPSLEERINSSFEDFIREIANIMEEHLKNDVFYPMNYENPFWFKVQVRFGLGPGYRAEVLDMYKKQLGDYESFLRDTTEKLWTEMVINKALDFLG